MTDKRFKFVCDDDNCFFKDNNKVLYCYEVVELLNELAEENEQLKQENRKLKEDLGHCANQFTNDGKNVLLSLR